jgi:L-tyrosine isonitrile synthase
MQQQDLLLAGHPASLERSREHALRNTPLAGKHRLPQTGGEIVDLSVRLSAKGREKPPGIDDRVLAQQILRTFNTWSFKREQPSDIGLMLNVISHTIRLSEPLSFALYWGKGPRCGLADPDMRCLDFLRSFSDRVKQGYAPGAVLNLIFTDTHAELNGYSQPGIEKYFHEVGPFARERGMRTRRLSELVRVLDIALGTDRNEADIEQATLLKLIASARKWYRGSGTPEDGARTYYRMNMVERRAVEAAFPNSIFITFNGSDLRPLFPQHLPIFYMYSLRRGFGVKPWFLPLDARPCTATACKCAKARLNN